MKATVIFMDNFPPVNPQKKKYSSAIIAVIICAALVAGAVSLAILNPKGGFDILPSFTGESRSKLHFSDMEYKSPRSEELISQLDNLIDMINRGDSFTDQRSVYNKINILYSEFMTMRNLAYIHYSADLTDEYFSNEYTSLELYAITVQNKLNLLHDTIAASSFKTNYERSYYGVGYFTDWKPLVYPDEVVKLMEEESALIEEYRQLMASPTVILNDNEITVSSATLGSLSDEDYIKVVSAYYSKYNKLAGEIYVKLVKLRLKIAELLDTDYVSYAYSTFDRDYTPADAEAYLDRIASDIIPVISQIEYDPSFIFNRFDPISAIYAVADGANNMKDVIDEAFDYMFDYGLYDIGSSQNKVPVSYTTYLYNYNVPFLFMSPMGNVTDFFTLAHEFGHFTDSYHNQSFEGSIDAAEVSSQAMAYIMPLYTNALRGYDQSELLKYAVYSATDIYTTQSYITRFEHEVYSLSESELTLDRLNEIAADCAEEFGLSKDSDIYSMSWIDITHIYEVPLYTVSYVISNDVALQVLDAELTAPGKGGVNAFLSTINRDADLTFTEEVVNSGFENPFADGRTKKIAEMIADILTGSSEDSSVESSAASAA